MDFSHLSLITVLLPGCFTVENLITRLHERCLRLICSDKISPCEELLDKDNSVLIHLNNLQKLDIEMFKTYTGIATQIKNEVFSRNCASNYNLRRDPQFASRAVNTVHYGSEPLDFLGSKKIWEMLLFDLKNSDSLSSFRSGIKIWRQQECPCMLCKKYIQEEGFTQV